MIYDHIRNASMYGGMHPGVAEALRILRKEETAELEPGKYELDGSRMFLLVQQYDSRPLQDGIWEAHRRYIDVQYVIRGAERMGVAPLERMDISAPYDETTDFASFTGKGTFFELAAGYFTILAPQDVHMACIAAGAPQPVKKLVMKVALSY